MVGCWMEEEEDWMAEEGEGSMRPIAQPQREEGAGLDQAQMGRGAYATAAAAGAVHPSMDVLRRAWPLKWFEDALDEGCGEVTSGGWSSECEVRKTRGVSHHPNCGPRRDVIVVADRSVLIYA